MGAFHAYDIRGIYNQAVGKFNQIATRHKLVAEGESILLHSIGNVEEKPLISDPSLKVFGKEAWQEYYNFEVEGEIPPPPKKIGEITKALRGRLKGKKVKNRY